MRSILLGAVAALGLCPAIASAAVSLNTETVTVTPPATDQTVFVNVFGIDTLPEENEQLNAFTLTIRGLGFGQNGVRFQLPSGGNFTPSTTYKPTGARDFVFRPIPQGFPSELEPPLENFGSTFDRIQVVSTVVGGEDVANITPANNGFIRLPIIVPAGTLPGTYTVTVDLAASQLGGAGAPIVTTLGQVGGVIVVPEPASLGLIVLGGLLTLRRRRVA